MASKPYLKVTTLAPQTGTEGTLYATWDWLDSYKGKKSQTDHFLVRWKYATGDGIGFWGSNSEGEEVNKNSYNYTFDPPENATHVTFQVRPVSEYKKKNDTEVPQWVSGWSTEKKFYMDNFPPATPEAPSVTIQDKYTLVATLSNIDSNATRYNFKVVQYDEKKMMWMYYKDGTVHVKSNHVTYSCQVHSGYKYKVNVQAFKGNSLQSEESPYSEEVGTVPTRSDGIRLLIPYELYPSTAVRINWYDVTGATSYEVQYTTVERYFDSSSDVQSVTVSVGYATITGLEPGYEYFFRVRAINDQGESEWTATKSIILGKIPSAPTTWSSTTTAMVGDMLTLYWVHNAEDNSKQREAKVEITVNGVTDVVTYTNTWENEEEEEKTYSHQIDTAAYSSGAKIKWRVQTRGILEDFSEWSIMREVDIYAPPTLSTRLLNQSGTQINTVTSFPVFLDCALGPPPQVAVSIHVAIFANASYDTVDYLGRNVTILAGQEIYSKYFDGVMSEEIDGGLLTENAFSMQFAPFNLDLENNVEYKIVCTSAMDSGLTAESTYIFNVEWEEETYVPDAEVGINTDNYSAYIRPYCEDANGELVTDVYLSVYRREYDGSYMEIASNLTNDDNLYITDPHPALDYARYRIVAISGSTGAISFVDLPGVYVGCNALVIQWDEAWSTFDPGDEGAALNEQPWSGSMLKLPYNLDISNSYSMDTSLVEYIGRKYPVSYYGTQTGETASWSTEIPKTDTETVYALTRLAKWPGNAYVREPSGNGYWANVKVSFSRTYLEVKIPVSFEVTRVEGGM